ncbi:MAG: hypothetical protein A2408_02970 [Candidatus Yonathbacteria bacterium RIFOXYC1_FULL_52_10]|nr:MAG: hypothetical protein A2408_02970 [Candidatus Yonathbacteria bacterium RIFOXYC1_FULL_52_10]
MPDPTKTLNFADLLTDKATAIRQTMQSNPTPELDLLRQAAGLNTQAKGFARTTETITDEIRQIEQDMQANAELEAIFDQSTEVAAQIAAQKALLKSGEGDQRELERLYRLRGDIAQDEFETLDRYGMAIQEDESEDTVSAVTLPSTEAVKQGTSINPWQVGQQRLLAKHERDLELTRVKLREFPDVSETRDAENLRASLMRKEEWLVRNIAKTQKRISRLWPNETVAETLEPARIIDEETTQSHHSMESSSISRSQQSMEPKRSAAEPVVDLPPMHDALALPDSPVVVKGIEIVAKKMNNGEIQEEDLPPELLPRILKTAEELRALEPKQDARAVGAAAVHVVDLEQTAPAVEDPTPALERDKLAATAIIGEEDGGPVVSIPVADAERELTNTGAPHSPVEEISLQKIFASRESKTPVSNAAQETSGAGTPAQTLESAPTPFETTLRKIHERDPEKAIRILNTIEGKDGPVREKFLKLITATETQQEVQLARAEKSLSEKAFGFVKNIGENYQRLPFAVKVGLGGVLWAGTILSSGALGAIFATGVVGRRMFTGAATAVTVEAALQRYHERKGGSRTETQEKKDRLIALMAGVLGASAGSLFSMASDALESSGATTAAAERIAEIRKELGIPMERASLLPNDPGQLATQEPTNVNFNDPDFGNQPSVLRVDNPSPLETFASASETHASFPGITEPLPLEITPDVSGVNEAIPLEKIEVSIKSGDNLWNIIKEKVDAQQLTANLTPDQKIRFINSLKNGFEALPQAEREALGFGHGDIDKIYAGKTLDLTKVLGNTNFVQEALHDAEMFDGHITAATPEAAAGISEQIVSAPATTPIEDIPASITETPVSEIPEKPASVAPENTLHDRSGNIVRDNFGNPVLAGENVSLDQAYVREHFAPKELGRLSEAVIAGPERGLSDALNVIYPPADGEVWTAGEKSASWTTMKGQSAWELVYRPESLGQQIAADPSSVKMRAFIQAMTEYNIQPERSETVEGFLKRALSVIAEKSPNRTWSA